MGVFAWLASTLTGGCDTPDAPPVVWPEHRALGPGGAVSSALSPSGRRIAVGTTRGVDLYDVGALTPSWTVPSAAAVTELGFSPDGAWVVGVSRDGLIRVWGANDGQLHHTHHVEAGLAHAAVSAERLAWAQGEQAGWLALDGGGGGTLRGVRGALELRWSPDGGALAAVDPQGLLVWAALDQPPARVAVSGLQGLAWSPDGQRLVASGHTVVQVDRAGAELGRWSQSPPAPAVAWSPRVERWLLGLETGNAQLRDARTGAVVDELAGFLGRVDDVGWGQEGLLVHGDHPIVVDELNGTWDTPSPGATKGLVFSPDGRRLAGVNRSQAQVLGWPEAQVQAVLPSLYQLAEQVLWTSDGALLLHNAARLTAWRPEGGGFKLAPPEGVRTVDAVAAHPQRPELATGWTRRLSTLAVELRIELWSTLDGSPLRTLVVDGQGLTTAWRMAYSEDGRWLAVQGGRQLRVYDAETGALRGRLDSVNGERGGLAWDPRGRWIASGVGQQVVLWDPGSGQVLRTLEGRLPGQGAGVLVVSPDGAWVAAWARDRDQDALWLWRSADGRAVGRPHVERLHKGQDLAFSADGALLAASSGSGEGGALWLVDTATGAQVHALRSDRGWGMALAWAPDGRSVVVDLGGGWVVQGRP